jgi:hypothetical protein
MRFLYFLRVFFVSLEFLVLALALLCVMYLERQASAIASALVINEELVKWAILLPITLTVWCAKEARDLIFSNPEHSKALVNWPDYWRLKRHIVVSLIFLAIFCVLSGLPWLSKSGIATGVGLIFFSTGLLGSVLVAVQLYAAKISINEIMYSE